MSHLLISMIFDNLPNLNLSSWQSEPETWTLLIADRKLRLHDEDEASCLIDILEQANEIFDVLILLVDERPWKFLDWILEVIPELSHPKKFSNSWPEFMMNDFCHIEPFDLLEELEVWVLWLRPCLWPQRFWATHQWTSERTPLWCCHSWVSFDCSAQELYRILWSEEVDMLECELFLNHCDEFLDHLSIAWNDQIVNISHDCKLSMTQLIFLEEGAWALTSFEPSFYWPWSERIEPAMLLEDLWDHKVDAWDARAIGSE